MKDNVIRIILHQAVYCLIICVPLSSCYAVILMRHDGKFSPQLFQISFCYNCSHSFHLKLYIVIKKINLWVKAPKAATFVNQAPANDWQMALDSIKSIMSASLIRFATSQSCSHPIVLTRLGGPCSSPNPLFKIVEVLGMEPATS